MLTIRGSVTFHDGRREAFLGGPAAMSRWERYAIAHHLPALAEDPAKAAGFTMSLFLAYASLHPKSEGGAGFDAWCDQVSDLELEIEADTPPTPPGVSAGRSPSSQS